MAFPMMLALLVVGALQKKTPSPSDEPFQIVDNSFLVEEAFNQEPQIFQNILGLTRQGHDWVMTFTQEWPAPGMRHQLSYTLGINSAGQSTEFGDVLLNYRLQVLEEGPGRPAFAPRVSAIVPSGDRSVGAGRTGLQVNLPFSKQHHDFYFHWNGGFTWIARADRPDLLSPLFAGSAIYRLRPMVNLMLESVVLLQAQDSGSGSVDHQTSFTLSPGVRGGWNVAKDAQVIVGLAVPIVRQGGETDTAVFGYFSYELPFGKRP
jgi:hypothetical protein